MAITYEWNGYRCCGQMCVLVNRTAAFWRKLLSNGAHTICYVVAVFHFNVVVEIIVIGCVYLVIQLNVVVISIVFNWFAHICYIICCREVTARRWPGWVRWRKWKLRSDDTIAHAIIGTLRLAAEYLLNIIHIWIVV